MAKRVVWTHTAKKARRKILEYWINHNGSSAYSKGYLNYSRLKSHCWNLKNTLANQPILRM